MVFAESPVMTAFNGFPQYSEGSAVIIPKLDLGYFVSYIFNLLSKTKLSIEFI
jgi:hypothetical protein